MTKIFQIKGSFIFIILSVLSFCYGAVKYFNVDFNNESYQYSHLFDIGIAFFSIVYSLFNFLLYVFCKNIFERIPNPSDKLLLKSKFHLSNLFLVLIAGIIVELVVGFKDISSTLSKDYYDVVYNYNYAEGIFFSCSVFSLLLFSAFMYLHYIKNKVQTKTYLFAKGYEKMGIYIYELFTLILLLYSVFCFDATVSYSDYRFLSFVLIQACIWNILILIYLHNIRVSLQRKYFLNWHDFLIIALLLFFCYMLGHIDFKYGIFGYDLNTLYYYESLLFLLFFISFIFFVLIKMELMFVIYLKKKRDVALYKADAQNDTLAS